MMTAAKRDETPPIPNSVIGVTKYVECKLSDLGRLFDVQLEDVRRHVDELRSIAGKLDEKFTTKAEHLQIQAYVDNKVESLEKAIDAAAKALEKRLDGMNELREAMKDQSSLMVTRTEFSAAKEITDADIRILRESRAELAGKASAASVVVAYVMAMLSMIIGIVSVVIEIVTFK
jgi:ribosome-associated translation inhibitor RaiA